MIIYACSLFNFYSQTESRQLKKNKYSLTMFKFELITTSHYLHRLNSVNHPKAAGPRQLQYVILAAAGSNECFTSLHTGVNR